jgi:anti-sigma-K factor RskA
MTAEHDTHPHDDLAIYALDALDPDEHAALEEHLAGCAACRAELEDHRATLARLVASDAEDEPPASVWAGIAQQLPSAGADASAGAPADAADVVPLHAPLHARRRGLGDRAGWLAAAAALVVVVGLAAVLIGRGSDDTSTVADLAAAAVDAPGSTVVPLQGDDGTELAKVVLTGEGNDYVIFDEAARLPSGHSFQLWKTQGTEAPISLGVLGDGSAGAVAIAAPADITSLALSDEPSTGSPQPRGPILATAHL